MWKTIRAAMAIITEMTEMMDAWFETWAHTVAKAQAEQQLAGDCLDARGSMLDQPNHSGS